MKRVGYARVSTEEQNLDLQLSALKQVGCVRIFTDQGISGLQAHRPGLDEAMAFLRPGHELVVWRLDRLGRSLINLINLIDDLGQRDIRFRSLNENIDTCSSGGRLVFHIMAALAEFERSLISERTRAGMAAARAQGKHIGRPISLTEKDYIEARRLIEMDGWRVDDVAGHYGVHAQTLRRLLKQHESEQHVH
ncbi:recombinase family protein [Bosea sp. MMO-172]|uniref:recombinase family protein n=1 Tax=Bosea sp. MMO-172 TaxID=3127885 RepID=UPI00301864B6